MSITDELREWFKDRFFMTNGWQEIHDIADRIDAEHESACAEAYGNGVMSVPIALDESAWVELPKDADGEYIRIGDVMEWSDGETFDVIGIGDGVLFYTESECDGPAEWTGASNKRHHHAPTVEDVLLDACKAYHSLMVESMSDVAHDMSAPSEVIAKYAKRLTLAEGEDA